MKCACSNRQKRLRTPPRGRNHRPGTYPGDGKIRPGMFEYHLEGEIHHEFNRPVRAILPITPLSAAVKTAAFALHRKRV